MKIIYCDKLLIVLCSFMITSCGRSCQSQNSQEIGMSTNEMGTAPVVVGQDHSGDLPTLKELQGVWFCSKYKKDDQSSLDYGLGEYNENFAKEFSKYIFLTISRDTLSAMDLFKTRIKVVKDSGNQPTDEFRARLTQSVNTPSDSLAFVVSLEPYKYYWEEDLDFNGFYTNRLLNRDKVLCNNELVLRYKDCFFFFTKDVTKQKSNCYGTPGDEDNYFKVKIRYDTTDIEKVCANFRRDYPFGAEKLLEQDNSKIIISHNWKEKKSLEVKSICYIAVDRDKTGMFVLKITVGKDSTDLLYYFNEEEGYSDDYQG